MLLLNRPAPRLAAASALLLLAAACGGGGDRVFDGVVTVSRGDVVVTVTANGGARLADPRALRFGAAGTVASVAVREGDRVEAGQTLAALETDALDLAALKADADLALAQEALDALLQSPDSADLALAEAAAADTERALGGAQAALAASAPKQTNAADAAEIALGDASDAYGLLFRTYYGFQPDVDEMTDAPTLILERRGAPAILAYYRGLFPVEVRQSDVDDALNAAWEKVRAAGRAYADALLALESARTTAARAVTQVRQALRAAEERLAAIQEPPTPAAVFKAQAARAAAQLAADNAHANREAAALTSPIAGVVTSLRLEPGDVVGPASTVAAVADPALLEVVALVDQRDLLLVREGQPAVLSAQSAPLLEAASGRVTAVGLLPAGQGPSVRYPVTIALDDPAVLPLRPGMEAFVSIEVERRDDVAIVPLGAVQRDGRQFVVRQVAEDGLTDRQVVVLGAYDDFNVEIIRGVREGDVVVDFSTVVTQSNFLRDGRPLP